MTKPTLFLALFTMTILSSCGTTYDLTFRVPDQMKNTYVMESTTTSESQVMGMNVENVMINNTTYSMKHMGQDAEGNPRLQMTYDAIRYEQSTMGQEVKYDSSNPAETNSPEIANMYDKLLGRPIDLTYNSRGQLIDAQGLTGTMDDMFESLPEESRETMKQQFGEDAILQAMKAMTHYFPEENKVKIGDSWTVNNEMAVGGMELIIDSEFTLLEVKDGMAKIKMESELSTDPDAPGLDLMGMQMKFDLQGTQSGILFVNEATSWLDRMELDQEMNGVMNMNSEQMGDMAVDMKVISQQLIQQQ
ncbi:MAG: DUF6263 family protein [Bacteroidota bacterium]